MKKTLLIMAFILASTCSLFAERATWFISEREDYKLKTGVLFKDEDLVARSNNYPVGSVLSVHSEESGRDVIITVSDKIYEPLNKDNLELSAAALEELGLFRKGGGEVTVTIIKEGSEKPRSSEESGWFSYETAPYQSADECYTAYARLIRNGARPTIELREEGLVLSVKNIREYEKSDAEKKLALSGIDSATLIEEANPYLR